MINLTKKQANNLFIIMIILVVAFMVTTLYFLYTYKEAYTSNPLSYGVKKMNLGQCTLTCFQENNFQPVVLFINSTSITQQFSQQIQNPILPS